MSDQETRTEDAADTAPAEAAEARPRGRQRGDKRELEQAPLMLRKAAKILFLGAILPFSVAIVYAGAGPEPVPWAALYGAKALALTGGLSDAAGRRRGAHRGAHRGREAPPRGARPGDPGCRHRRQQPP